MSIPAGYQSGAAQGGARTLKLTTCNGRVAAVAAVAPSVAARRAIRVRTAITSAPRSGR